MPIVDLATQPVVPTAYGRWQALNAPLGTAKAWVRRGLTYLKNCLEAVGVHAS